MWFSVLGPLTVRANDFVVVVSPGKQRVILAALLVRTGQVVSFDELAEAVWGDAPPESSRATVKNYVKRLRRLLGPSAGSRIVTRYPGYLIEAAADEVDLLAFELGCREGTAAARAGNWHRASQVLGDALELWRGTPLADVPSEALAREHQPRLEQLRLHALEARIDADVRLGRHREVIAELEALTAEQPLREHLHALLMLSLHRDGRQGEALAAYQRARRVLVGELGVEPGRELRELQREVLDGVPRLDGEAELMHSRVSEPEPVVPRQLPPAIRQFTGRQRELNMLSRLLARDDGAAGTPAILAIGGTAGAGKTALAVYWAHHAAAGFPGGMLYVNLHGFGPSGAAVRPADAIRGFLDALGVPVQAIPADLEAQAALYRRLLVGKQLLIVLDNARDEWQVRPLLPATADCLVIVTSRRQLTGLAAADGASLLTLDVLSEQEARELLAARLGAGRLACEPAVVGELISLCARLPLALAIAAARAAARPSFPLAALTAELRDARNPLDALDTGEPVSSVRAVFSWSYQQLTAAAAAMFRLLGVHPGPDITVPAAASAASIDLRQARQALSELAGAHLAEERVPGRFALHDLLRAYATEQAEAMDNAARRRITLTRILDHYLHTGHAAALLLHSARDPITLTAPQSGVLPEHLGGHGQALAWFAAEHKVLLAVAAQAADGGFDTHAWQIPWTLADFLDRQGRWHDLAATHRNALAAAERLGKPSARAHASQNLGRAQMLLGSYDEARAHLGYALGQFQEVGDRVGQARTHITYGRLAGAEGRLEEALSHAMQAVELFQAAGDQAGHAHALNNAGWYQTKLGYYRQSLAYYRRALKLQREHSDRLAEAQTLDGIGYTCHRLGRYRQAVIYYQRSLRMHQGVGERFYEGLVLAHLSESLYACRDFHAADAAWKDASAILNELPLPNASQLDERLRHLVDQLGNGHH
jgi:DNA-binding SARP family transcriptional activator/Tfp pilus assembly protein PilF